MPACLAARANLSVPSRFTEYVAAGLRLPSGSLDSAARQSTASYPASSAAMPSRMSSVALVPASAAPGPGRTLVQTEVQSVDLMTGGT